MGIQNLDNQSSRNSEDRKANPRGSGLLDVCKLNDFLILNGRTTGDLFGSFTSQWNGSSVGDYALTSHQWNGSSVVDYALTSHQWNGSSVVDYALTSHQWNGSSVVDYALTSHQWNGSSVVGYALTSHQWNGSSVVGYALTSNIFTKNILEFRVGNFVPWLSDHCPLHITICINKPLVRNVSIEEAMADVPPGFMWNENTKNAFAEGLTSILMKQKMRILEENNDISPVALVAEIKSILLSNAVDCKLKVSY